MDIIDLAGLFAQKPSPIAPAEFSIADKIWDDSKKGNSNSFRPFDVFSQFSNPIVSRLYTQVDRLTTKSQEKF